MITDLRNWQPNSTDKLIFDTNVWLLLHCQIGNYKAHIVSKYSNFYKNVIAARAPVFVSSLVLAEFINAYLRIDFKAYNQLGRFQDYKRDYRPSPEYTDTFGIIRGIVKNKILSKSNRINDDFNVIAIDDILDASEYVDYNDSYYAQLAKLANYKIVTDDGDFIRFSKSTDILTSNPKLLVAQNAQQSRSGGTAV